MEDPVVTSAAGHHTTASAGRTIKYIVIHYTAGDSSVKGKAADTAASGAADTVASEAADTAASGTADTASSGAAASAGSAKREGFQVKVSIDNLNIRTGPGTDFAVTGKYTGKGVFTIAETSEGTGSAAGWGLLKAYRSGRNGWISLDYAVRV